MEMMSPQGEVLDIPAEGVHAMRALGWEPTGQPDPEPKAAPVKRNPRKKTTPPKG